jgi:hypothetical protein
MSRFNKQELTGITLFNEYSNWNRNRGELRFGQYMCNKYLLPGETAPEIFYEENSGTAFDLIAKET